MMLQFEDVLFEVLIERQACGLGSHFSFCSLLFGHECRPGSGFCDLDACESGFLQLQNNNVLVLNIIISRGLHNLRLQMGGWSAKCKQMYLGLGQVGGRGIANNLKKNHYFNCVLNYLIFTILIQEGVFFIIGSLHLKFIKTEKIEPHF